MPLYEYRCEQCQEHFEVTQSVYARVEDTECPRCHARQATRLMSSFSSSVSGDRKPGFTELKAKAMGQERMQRFAKLPPLNARRTMPPPNMSSDSDAPPKGESTSES